MTRFWRYESANIPRVNSNGEFFEITADRLYCYNLETYCKPCHYYRHDKQINKIVCHQTIASPRKCYYDVKQIKCKCGQWYKLYKTTMIEIITSNAVSNEFLCDNCLADYICNISAELAIKQNCGITAMADSLLFSCYVCEGIRKEAEAHFISTINGDRLLCDECHKVCGTKCEACHIPISKEDFTDDTKEFYCSNCEDIF